MALYSLLVEHEGESFSTQVAGTSAEEALRRFFAQPIARAVSPVLGPQDILYVTPMTDLVNLWTACAGREGRYVSITVARTVEQQEV